MTHRILLLWLDIYVILLNNNAMAIFVHKAVSVFESTSSEQIQRRGIIMPKDTEVFSYMLIKRSP